MADTAKDDRRFYAYLTQLLNGDLSAVLKFDRTMVKERKPEKSFWVRSAKAVTAHLARPLEPAHILDDLGELCSDKTLATETHLMAHFLMRLHLAQTGPLKSDHLNDPQGDEAAKVKMPDVSTVATPADVKAELAEWQRGTAALAAFVVQATEPDPELAQQIVAEAQSLLALAEAYSARSALRLRITERLAALRSRLDDCLTSGELALRAIPEQLPDTTDIARLEVLVEACEVSARALAASDRQSQELKDAVAKANDADDFEVADRLLQQRRNENNARKQLLAARETTIEELVLVLEISPPAQDSEGEIAETLLPTADPVPAEVAPEPQPVESAVEDDEAEQDGAAAPLNDPEPTITALDEPEPEARTVAPEVASTTTGGNEPECLPEVAPEAFQPPVNELVEATASLGTLDEGPEIGPWSAAQDIGDILHVYLRRGDTLLAAYLLELAEEKGVIVPFPAALF